MAEIHHQIGVKAETEKTYQAISTLAGLSHWWTKTTGEATVGGSLHFHFAEQSIEMTIKDMIENKKITWLCTQTEGEWQGTIITFELTAGEQQTLINFSHTKWARQSSLCAHCNTKWAVFMLSLKNYLETGKGRPFPDDIHIDHTEYQALLRRINAAIIRTTGAATIACVFYPELPNRYRE